MLEQHWLIKPYNSTRTRDYVNFFLESVMSHGFYVRAVFLCKTLIHIVGGSCLRLLGC